MSEGVPVVVQQVKNLTSIHEDTGSIPDIPRWVKDNSTMSCSIVCRHSSDLMLLYLGCMRAAAPLAEPLARALPQVTLGSQKEKKKKKKKGKKERSGNLKVWLGEE